MWLKLTNTLAYHTMASITGVKMFRVQVLVIGLWIAKTAAQRGGDVQANFSAPTKILFFTFNLHFSAIS